MLGSLNNIKTIYGIISLILPGYVVYSVINKMVTYEIKSDFDKTIMVAWYTLTCSLIMNFFAEKFSDGSCFIGELFTNDILSLITSIFIAFILGVAIGEFKIHDLLSNILKLFHIQSKSSSFTTGWERAFYTLEPAYLEITFNDGTTILGSFDKNGMASTDINNKDIFLSEYCTYDKNEGSYKLDKSSGGIWINANEVRCISICRNLGTVSKTNESEDKKGA